MEPESKKLRVTLCLILLGLWTALIYQVGTDSGRRAEATHYSNRTKDLEKQTARWWVEVQGTTDPTVIAKAQEP